MNGGSRVDTLNEASETVTDSQVGSGNAYLVPGGGTVDAHRFTDTPLLISRRVPDGRRRISGLPYT